MRTIVALGITVSAGIRNLKFAVLAGFGLLFALHISLIVVMGATIYIVSYLLGSLGNLFRIQSLLFSSAALLLGTLAIGFVLNYFYRRIQRFAIHRAYRTAFRTD